MILRSASTLLFLILLQSQPTLAGAEPVTLYVSPEGKDEWSGWLEAPNAEGTDGPKASVPKAFDALIQLRTESGRPEASARLLIREGFYVLDRPIAATGENRLTVAGYTGEKVRLSGARRITQFQPVTDEAVLKRIPEEARKDVVQCDLKAEGITDYGKMTARGFGQPVYSAGLELFFNQKPMQVARWPNTGWVRIADVPDGATSGNFVYGGDRPDRWMGAEDLWIHGFWTWNWADSYAKVAKIDSQNNRIYTSPPHGVYGYSKERRYYAINLIEELDQPGEWYLNRETGVLYFWAPEPVADAEVLVSVADRLIHFKDCSNCEVVDLTLEGCRGNAVQIDGGQSNRVSHCHIRNVGNTGVILSGGVRNQVTRCELEQLGDGGISISGGDRRTLSPGNHLVENNHIHHYNRWSLTYRPAVALEGVAHKVAHNHIHDAPHNAIQLHGNEHVIEYNVVHHACQETADAGAFYMGRDWTQRGNIVRYNYFHHIGGKIEEKYAFSEAMGVYLDDWSSGTVIHGNLFYKSGRAILVGGGRDNIVTNNFFIDCHPAVHIDSRGLGWAKNYFSGETTTLTDRMEAMKATQPPYSLRYPKLVSLYADEPAVAKYNRVVNNVAYNCKWIDLMDGLNEETVHLENNWTEGDPGFVDPEKQDFQLKPDAPILELGIDPLPIERMGIVSEE